MIPDYRSSMDWVRESLTGNVRYGKSNFELALGLFLLIPDVEGKNGCYYHSGNTDGGDNFHVTSP